MVMSRTYDSHACEAIAEPFLETRETIALRNCARYLPHVFAEQKSACIKDPFSRSEMDIKDFDPHNVSELGLRRCKQEYKMFVHIIRIVTISAAHSCEADFPPQFMANSTSGTRTESLTSI